METKTDCVERNPEPIQVHLLTPDCDAENTEINLELVCILLGSGRGEVEVESLINGVVVRPKVKVILSGKQGSGYSSFIKQNITKKSWDEGDRYTFRVTRLPGIGNIELYNTSKCEGGQ
uniref:Uncharacterized protein n=1 Tax=Sphaerodactylus townsendi TaxID=933632 RepID=A0ACB8EW76_9SAUR